MHVNVPFLLLRADFALCGCIGGRDGRAALGRTDARKTDNVHGVFAVENIQWKVNHHILARNTTQLFLTRASHQHHAATGSCWRCR